MDSATSQQSQIQSYFMLLSFFAKRKEFLHENPRFYLKKRIDTMNPEELYNYINDLKYTQNEDFDNQAHMWKPNYANFEK